MTSKARSSDAATQAPGRSPDDAGPAAGPCVRCGEAPIVACRASERWVWAHICEPVITVFEAYNFATKSDAVLHWNTCVAWLANQNR